MSIERRQSKRMGMVWALAIGIGLVGCNRSVPKKPDPSVTTPAPSSASKEATALAPTAAATTVPPHKDSDSVATRANSAITVTAPLSVADIERAQQRIDHTTGYPTRLEARRALLYPLCAAEQISEAKVVFEAVLNDILANEGEEMAQRAGLADVQNLASQKRFRAAIALGEQLITRWPVESVEPYALDVIASSHLDLQGYAQAEQAWHRVIEQYDSWSRVDWAWRRLALAQLLQGHFDESLATLAIMAEKYADCDMGEYARARKGYVLMAAGRFKDAESAYSDFLDSCQHSKYCNLVRQQKHDLETTKRVAMARSSKPHQP